MQTINITPNPRILEVITNNPMPPINAICELIDNGIDSFGGNFSKSEGNSPLIEVNLPTSREIDNNIGKIIVRDNGKGLTRDEANNAVKAGYSGNEPIGKLGLFGMGFNISTGKLGKKTIFKSARKEDKKVFCITIDIPQIVISNTFDVPIEEIPKPYDDYSGVEIEISDWWEEGTQNYGFIKKLVNIGGPKLSEQIGRRYSTLLRKNLQILINNRKCPIFHHCVWDKKRSVERLKHGRIPARIDFSEILRTEKRCFKCGSLIESSLLNCPLCYNDSNIRITECKIKGWVGIQRFDDVNRFGLDFIRYGRAILIDEKEAVFSWVPEETGTKLKEYPVDGIYGRIIGEVHIDHVPTDFLKNDFQRTSPEWLEVIKYLRGESSLLPETQRQFNEPENNSPIYKLFQGYRKVRKVGTTDMYIGYWDESKGEPSRINRSEEKELYDKFLINEPGYGPGDDSGWWALVERAEIRPTPEMKECPNCGMQNLKEADRCASCGNVLIPKNCVECGATIARSDLHCLHCGASQVPEEEEEWICNSCLRKNPPEAYRCRKCNLPRGTMDVLKEEFLKENSNLIDYLCVDSLSVELPGGVSMSSLKLFAYYVNDNIFLQRQKEKFRLPAVVHYNSNEMHIYLDRTHPIYNKYQDRPEDIISMEIAKWIRQNYEGRISPSDIPLWSISNLYYLIHSQIWAERIELDSEIITHEIKEFFALLRERLPNLLEQDAQRIYENLDEHEQSSIIVQLHRNNLIYKQKELIEDGGYLEYVPDELMIHIFEEYPDKFFDGNFWEEPYEKLDVPDTQILEKIKKEISSKYQRCLEDMLSFVEYRNPDTNYIRKIDQTLRMIKEHLNYQRKKIK